MTTRHSLNASPLPNPPGPGLVFRLCYGHIQVLPLLTPLLFLRPAQPPFLLLSLVSRDGQPHPSRQQFNLLGANPTPIPPLSTRAHLVLPLDLSAALPNSSPWLCLPLDLLPAATFHQLSRPGTRRVRNPPSDHKRPPQPFWSSTILQHDTCACLS